MAAAPASAWTVRPAEEVKEEVREFYQDLTLAWEKLWGDHLHHGFYDPGVTAPSPPESSTAAVRLVEEALRFAGVSDDPPEKRPKRIVDVGCGVGGASIYLAKKYEAHCDGINITPIQIERARAHAAAAGLEDKVKFHLVDAVAQPFPDDHFDLVWCMEAAEHMADKEKNIKTADWSENVLPTWPDMMQTAMSLEGSTLLLESGMATIKAILMGPTMVECLKKKLINYNILTFRKP